MINRRRLANPVLRLAMALTLSACVSTQVWSADDEEAIKDEELAEEEPAKPKEPPKPHVTPDADETRFEFLARQSDPREIMQLTALDEEVLALFLPENQAQARGAVLILHEEDTHPDWPTVVNPVRTLLPDYGWATITVAIPSPGPAIQPERTLAATEVFSQMPDEEETEEDAPAAEEGAEEELADEADDGPVKNDEEGDELGGEDEADAPPPVPEKPKAPVAERVKARIDAALAQLQSMNYNNVVLMGHGVGAAWLLGYLKEQPLEPTQPLIMVQARLPFHDIGLDLPGLLGEQQRPVLDLYYADSRFALKMAKQRADFARRSGNPGYRQTRLPGNSVNGQTDARGRRVVQSVRGWLDSRLARDPERQPEDPYLKAPEGDPYLPGGVRSEMIEEEKSEDGQSSRQMRNMM
ncbi:DUF3530 family protein [Oceanospirillum sediminis]|uniref:Alpha/beta hydrolase family protein n=1 Tax=Oceanospirillum sediminis TaxID=2760088 RepID=A0A839IUJ2_9GAMM|nr:alpha/beta hydrolase family protein [Oceanospirillum sediminis]